MVPCRGGGVEVDDDKVLSGWPRALTFDAPTREFCTIRRSTTNTPLQALVLWNDEQFVEAARELAALAMRQAGSGDAQLTEMYERTTGRALAGDPLRLARETLKQLEARYRAEPAAAAKLLAVGDRPVAGDLEPARHAALTMLASAFLDLDASIYID